MKKKIILIAAVIGTICEIAAVIYTRHTREIIAYGGEYLVLPLFLVMAVIVIEIINIGAEMKFMKNRLTVRTKSGQAVLNKDAFPEYAEETLIREVNAFAPIKTVIEKLCDFEDRYGGESDV